MTLNITTLRKPLSETVAQSVLEYGTGGLNIDACRIETSDTYSYPNGAGGNGFHGGVGRPPDGSRKDTPSMHDQGRWPTNLLLTESSASHMDLVSRHTKSRRGNPRSGKSGDGWGMSYTGAEYDDEGGPSRFFRTFPNE